MCRSDRINKQISSLFDILIKLKTEFIAVLETPLAVETWEWWINFNRQLDDLNEIFDRQVEILLAVADWATVNLDPCLIHQNPIFFLLPMVKMDVLNTSKSFL